MVLSGGTNNKQQSTSHNRDLICVFLLEYSMKSPLSYLSIFHLISLWGCLWSVRSAEFFGDAKKDLDTKTNNNIALAVSHSWAIDSGSNNYYYCPIYSASDTNSAISFSTTSQCYLSMCPGDTISLGSCSSYAHGGVYPECSGNQLLRLVDIYGNEVATSSTSCSGCAELSYTVPSYTSCQMYTIWEGCYSAESCSGQVGIYLFTTTSPTWKPTQAPTAKPSMKPTPVPTARPSLKPTPAPTTTVTRSWAIDSGNNYYYCPFYSVSNTNSATNFVTTPQCYLSMCPGDTITLGSCSSYAHGGVYPECSGNQLLRLVDIYGNEVATSSASCSGCAELSYTVPSYTSCQMHTIWEGCYSAESCSGQVGIHLS
eukprot:scaffold5245_cov183-Ochromonas_danica.AAC.10